MSPSQQILNWDWETLPREVRGTQNVPSGQCHEQFTTVDYNRKQNKLQRPPHASFRVLHLLYCRVNTSTAVGYAFKMFVTLSPAVIIINYLQL